MRKLWWTAALFVIALVCVGLSVATKSVVPVFVAWVPLLGAAWVLNRSDAPDGVRKTSSS
jgi:hypothetical protein